MNPAISPDGYLKSMFQNDDGKTTTQRVHSLIALTFLGERPCGMQVNHKDGNKLNNAISNLEYVTISENIKHAYKNGLLEPRNGEKNGMAKLTNDAVRIIRRTALESKSRYYGRKQLAERFGVSVATIKDIVTRRRNSWADVSDK